MRIPSIAIPLLALAPCISASLAGEAFMWANSLVSSDQAATKGGEMHTMDSWSYKDCGLATDVVQLKKIVVKPDPPVPGENLTVTVDAEVLREIEDGATADVTVKLGLIKLLQKTFDICEEARNANATVQCPVDPGTYSVSQTVELPKEIPKAKFSVAVRGYTVDEDDLLCLDLFVDFVRHTALA
ncbi:ML domain-containing protein [Papiliotrema laurentii]|uniref:Phosphatidylglycerol/phosphatidylinositol transfer protein n=1 Tax=Papiliotrema laurentii TaxID=5418 RepID=A0AAD9FSZ1_PAPLA|nr:ML domain-containing protein [Papiliotrema laurentii]